MKTTALILLSAFASGLVALAGPLQKEQIPADAKWLLHLDVESGLKTQLGSYFGTDIIAQQIANKVADLKDYFGVDLDWRKFQSFTAYGTDYEGRAGESGVLIVKSSQDIPAMLDRIITKFEEASGPGKGSLRKATEGTLTRYTLNKDVFGVPGRGGVFVMSKSSVQLSRAIEVLDGKMAHLGSAKTFAAFSQPASSFFFLALADGFNNVATLPPQARMLKNSTGGQLVLGEKAGNVFAQLALSTKDSESTAQIQQLLQGLLALAALNEDKNKELARLAQAVKISTNETLVNVSLEWPATNLIARVKEERIKRGK